MDISKVSVGKNPPHEINVIIENSAGGVPVKYEFDKDSGFLKVDRFIHTPMFYPGNYGFIPHTLSGDGDPADALVVSTLPVIAGAIIAARPVGVLMMEDDGGEDEKIIAVPTDKMYPYHKDVNTHADLPEITLQSIEHFFTHYKDLEKGKWVKILGWKDADAAKEVIEAAIQRGQSKAA